MNEFIVCENCNRVFSIQLYCDSLHEENCLGEIEQNFNQLDFEEQVFEQQNFNQLDFEEQVFEQHFDQQNFEEQPSNNLPLDYFFLADEKKECEVCENEYNLKVNKKFFFLFF